MFFVLNTELKLYGLGNKDIKNNQFFKYVKTNLPSCYAQSPDFLKPGLCYCNFGQKFVL